MSATPRKDGASTGGGTLLPFTLALFVVISALAVVQIKNEHRRLATKSEALRVEHERLELEWAQLQLEEATLAQAARIEPIARAQFGLVEPGAFQIVEAGRTVGQGAVQGAVPGATAGVQQ